MRRKASPSYSAFLNRNTDIRLTRVPLEWLGGGPWRLPSGKALAEFALQAGFLTPTAFRPGWFGRPASVDEGGEGSNRKRVQRA
ncbi:MAG TPA: hypothetical protein VMJ34_20555 [Bryobacteraceae bacterium]|nr:hypothetical protein [Bryobacteraceae bacterium]